MADITNPQAIKFSNEQIRPCADKFCQLYWWGKQIVSDWTSKNMAQFFPNDESPVMDGSDVDGRTPITGFDVNVLLAHINEYIADMEANSSLKLHQIQKIAVIER